MSVYIINYKDGAKVMRPVLTRKQYTSLRNSRKQISLVASIRKGNTSLKNMLVQMNYSCLPNESGSLKGSTRMSTTIGMDVDWTPSPLPREGGEQTTASKEEWLKKVPELVLKKKEELGLLMLERSATKGYHLVFKRRPELSQEENLRWASELLGVEYDKGAKDITRVFFTTTASEEDLIYLDDEIFQIKSVECSVESLETVKKVDSKKLKDNFQTENSELATDSQLSTINSQLKYRNIPYSEIISRWWEMNGGEPQEGERNVKLYQLAVNLRSICDNNKALLLKIMPRLGLDEAELRGIVDSACKEIPKGISKAMKEVIDSIQNIENEDDADIPEEPSYYDRLPKMPMGVRESIEAVGPNLSMPTLTAICPCIGALATGVRLDVHGTKNSLNLISYIAGDFASGKGNIDPVIEAWTSEVKAIDKVYLEQESEWRRKKRAAKNKEEQPEEPKLPVRILTLNNTVANLAERLANTDGKHAFSFTPEADTVAQKWKTAMSDFSVMLRQSYDGSSYEREARSADAVNVHIDRLLWNVTMCGTPDALYRVVNNYTDGFQSRLAVARTPDNTFSPLEENPYVITEEQKNRIGEVAHLLTLMNGTVVLPKLEQRGREWLEQIRQEAMMNDDKVRARQRFRICVTAQRMICCIMLCKVAEELIAKHGFEEAEKEMKAKPDLWKKMLLKAQTPQALEAYDVVADYLLDCALFFFRERIEYAFNSREYAGTMERKRTGRNDSIFECLDYEFNFDSAFQFSAMMKRGSVSHNQVQQMLKNWKKQGLIVQTESGYRKVQEAQSLSH